MLARIAAGLTASAAVAGVAITTALATPADAGGVRPQSQCLPGERGGYVSAMGTYQNCADVAVQVHVDYFHHDPNTICVGPGEIRNMPLDTKNAYYNGHRC